MCANRQEAKVVFLIHDLRVGGAERAFLTYLRHLRSYRPIGALLRNRVEFKEEIPRRVPIYDLSLPGPPGPLAVAAEGGATGGGRPGNPPPLRRETVSSLARKAHRLRALLAERKATVVSSFLQPSHIVALYTKLLLDRRLKVVVNVHEIVTDHLRYHHSGLRRWMLDGFIRAFFSAADLVIAVSESVKEDLAANFRISPRRIVVVHTPVDLVKLRSRAEEEIDPGEAKLLAGRLVVAAGRLVKLKGFDLLIQAFAQLGSHPDLRLLIVGDGPERERLVALIGELGLEGRVALLGFRENPWKYMARARIFVLSSLTEAFPNVIGEALALGIPVLATECSGGVREYLDGGRAGVLVPPGDVHALAVALERMLTGGVTTRQVDAGKARMRDLGLPVVIGEYETALARAGVSPASR